MSKNTAKLCLMLLTALVIGGIGAFGQAYMIHHELADCYPYKVMSFPPASFYRNIADYGFCFAPLVAIAAGFLFGLKRFWLALIAPVVLCPLIYAEMYKIAFVLRERSGILDTGRNFDGTLSQTVTENFFSLAVWLSIEGLIVGAVIGFLLTRLFTAKKLA